MSDWTLLTGGTGFVGQYLLRDLIRAQQRVAVLIRDNRRMTAAQRWTELALALSQDLSIDEISHCCRLVRGDILEPHCGISSRDRQWLSAHCNRVLHCGADVSFTAGSKGSGPEATNLDGTRNILRLMEQACIGDLHYVSTAYVCGHRAGETVYEDELATGQTFRNSYERSKFAAETAVRESGLPSVTVYRPSIVVGDTQSGATTAFQSFYLVVRFTALHAALAPRNADGTWWHPVRLRLTGEEPVNLVPVDWVSRALVQILQSPAAHGKTYHLTPQPPTTTRQIEDALAAYFQYEGVRFVGPENSEAVDRHAVEDQFDEFMRQYAAYWGTDPYFDTTNTRSVVGDDMCQVDAEMLQRLIDYAVVTNFGRRTPAEPLLNEA